MTNTHPARRRLVLAAGLGSLLIILGACSSAASPSAPASQAASQSAAASTAAASESAEESAGSGPTVTITGFTSFGVSEITVDAGQDLTVVNDSSSDHTFTEGQNGKEATDSVVNQQIEAGETETVVFEEPGDYNVTCLFHSAMNMVVHVE
jgi:plastocyanin